MWRPMTHAASRPQGYILPACKTWSCFCWIQLMWLGLAVNIRSLVESGIVHYWSFFFRKCTMSHYISTNTPATLRLKPFFRLLQLFFHLLELFLCLTELLVCLWLRLLIISFCYSLLSWKEGNLKKKKAMVLFHRNHGMRYVALWHQVKKQSDISNQA